MAVRVVRTTGLPIARILQLEEALYRASTESWLLLHRDCSPATVVVGTGGKVDQLVDVRAAARRRVPVYRRFTGGGTVVVDKDSVFVSVIGDLAVLQCGQGPRAVMEWSAAVYAPVFDRLFSAAAGAGYPPPPGPFALQGHDYALGLTKMGGNAQALSRRRVVHHTSFLWDYDDGNMAVLLPPPSQPDYRAGRSHAEFLCKLSHYLPSIDAFHDEVEAEFASRFGLEAASWRNDVEPLEHHPYFLKRTTNTWIQS